MRLSGAIKIMILVMACAPWVHGATLHLEVEVDKACYFPGETVNWTLYAWADPGDNDGVALLSVNLDDDAGEPLGAPAQAGGEFTDTEYGISENFVIAGAGGTLAATSPRLRDVNVLQFPNNRMINIGNDGVRHVYCKGSYTVSIMGTHALTATLNAANYWPDAISNALEFENSDTTPAAFDVVPEPIVCGNPGTVYLAADIAQPPDCYVNLKDYAVVHGRWLDNTCVATGWCDGADQDQSGDVGLPDLQLWVTEWLWCTDPANASCDIYWKCL